MTPLRPGDVQLNLTPRECGVLAAIVDGRGRQPSTSSLARALGCSRRDVNADLMTLERLELVEGWTDDDDREEFADEDFLEQRWSPTTLGLDAVATVRGEPTSAQRAALKLRPRRRGRQRRRGQLWLKVVFLVSLALILWAAIR